MSRRIKMKACDKALSTSILATLHDDGYDLTFNQLVQCYDLKSLEENVYLELCVIESFSIYEKQHYDPNNVEKTLFGRERDIIVDGPIEDVIDLSLSRFHEVREADSQEVVPYLSQLESDDHVVSAAILASNLRLVDFVRDPGKEGNYKLNSKPIRARGTIIVPGYYNLSWLEVRFDGTNLTVVKSRLAVRVVAKSYSTVNGIAVVDEFDVDVFTLEEPVLSLLPSEIEGTDYAEKSRVMNGSVKDQDESLRR